MLGQPALRLVPWIAITVMSGFQFGCGIAPPPTLAKLSPVDTSETAGYWLQGKWVMSKSRPDYSLALTYQGMREERLVFGLTVINDSRSKIDFNPNSIRLVYRDTTLEPLNNVRLSDSLQSEYALELAKANPYSPNLVHITGTLLNATFGLVSALTLHQETESERKSRREYEATEADRERNEIEWESGHRRRLQYLQSESEFWSEAAMGRTTAFPGDSLSGHILFPHHVRADTVELVIPLGKGEERFQMAQSEIKPSAQPRSRSLAPTDED
jgi:hypothetical protein